MKKILLLFLLVVIASMCVSAKNFYYKGVGFEYKKGSFTGTGDGSTFVNVVGNTNGGTLMVEVLRLEKNENSSYSVTPDSFLDKVRTNYEEMESTTMRIERTGEIEDGFLNGIKGRQFDAVSKTKLMRTYTRVFCYMKGDWLVKVTFTGIGKEFSDKTFAPILKSFSFSPESNY